jgi:flagellar protein FlbD
VAARAKVEGLRPGGRDARRRPCNSTVRSDPMIQLHKLSHEREPFHLNPDLIERIDASPDCHVSLTTGMRIAVCESVDEVVERVRAWRVDILAKALAISR